MNTIDLLIIATAAGPVAATLAAPGFTGAVLALARARAQRVKHVQVSGTDLFGSGVPLTESQFREVFAVYQAALAELPPPADGTDWDMGRQFTAAQRLAVLTGTHPPAFPSTDDSDEAWEWYAANSSYAAAGLTQVRGVPVSLNWTAGLA